MTVSSSLSKKQVLDQTNIYFLAMGGDAATATQIIGEGSGTATDMFEAVRKAIRPMFETYCACK